MSLLRKPSGLGFEFSPEGNREGFTLSCGHCGRMKVFMEKKTGEADLGGVCYVCWRLICGLCADEGTCKPLEEWLQKNEAEFQSRRSMGLT